MISNEKVPKSIAQRLAQKDALLKPHIEQSSEMEIPYIYDPFYSLIRSVVHQQLSTSAATTIFSRLKARADDLIVPEVLHQLQTDELRQLGLSGQKVRYVHDISRQFIESPNWIDTLGKLSDEEVIKRLCKLKGIGPWTAQMFLMFTLKRPDVFPVGDLGIRKAITQLYGIPVDAPLAEFETLAERWAPYRSYASHYLWYLRD